MGAATSKSPVRNSRSKSARRVPHRGNSRCANGIAHVVPRVEKRWPQQRLPGCQIEQTELTTPTYHQETQLIHNGAGHRASRKIANHIGLAKVMPTRNKLHTSIMLLLKPKYTPIQHTIFHTYRYDLTMGLGTAHPAERPATSDS